MNCWIGKRRKEGRGGMEKLKFGMWRFVECDCEVLGVEDGCREWRGGGVEDME